MNKSSRQLFEQWISSSPYEREVVRYDENGTWPGQYKRINVALAWDAWQQGARMMETTPVELKRYIVCGGRDFSDWQFMMEKLDSLLRIDWNFVLVHGDARGADRMAGDWGNWRSVIVEPHPANWDLYRKKAGPIRNQEMLDTGIDGVVAFKGGYGTADMVRRATEAGIPVWDLRGE